VIRPAVLFGRDDKFLNTLIKLLHRLPVFPMFGRGETRLQPADVEDVAEAVATVMQRTETAGLTFECGGPRAYSYEELLRTIARSANAKRMLVPVPFAAWQGLAWIAEMLPGAPLTRNQVDLMQIDTVASPDQPGFAALGISPRPMEEVLQNIFKITDGRQMPARAPCAQPRKTLALLTTGTLGEPAPFVERHHFRPRFACGQRQSCRHRSDRPRHR